LAQALAFLAEIFVDWKKSLLSTRHIPMVHFRDRVLFTLFLAGAARRSVHVGGSHHDAQQQTNTRTETQEVSSDAREVLVPRSLSGLFRSRGPQTDALHAAYGHAASGPEKNHLPPKHGADRLVGDMVERRRDTLVNGGHDPAGANDISVPSLSLSASRREALKAAAAASTVMIMPPARVAASVSGDREVSPIVQYVGRKGQKPIQVNRLRFTGVGDKAWTFAQRDITELLYSEGFPAKFPYTAADFERIDEAPDSEFYKFPKLVYHIDEGAVSALTRYYDKNITDGSDVLDICSSWVSHYPRDFPQRMKSIVGSGISDIELQCNDQLSSYVAQDLNKNPKLPFPDRSFDVVTCVVSFDYLTRPLEVMKEVARVLRPGGQVILSQSNRCFFTKAVGVWTRDMSDAAHLRVLGTYIHFAEAFSEPQAFDISPKGPGTNDPMYIVTATRRG